jgi:EpsI family protein
MSNFLQSKSARILTVLLLVQAGTFYGFSRSENVPKHTPLSEFSLDKTAWAVRQDVPLDQETLDVLKADDILSRVYQNKVNGHVATLFVAYFSTQRTGKTPHSPKNCLPGSGWVQMAASIVHIPVPGESEPIAVNDYSVARGDNQSVVLYWYQARDRVIASEYAAKIFTVTDSIRYNRSDTALVRVVVAASDGNTQAATDTAISFVKAFFGPLLHFLPA